MAPPPPNSPARVPLLLQGRTVESILDALREAGHWHHQVSNEELITNLTPEATRCLCSPACSPEMRSPCVRL